LVTKKAVKNPVNAMDVLLIKLFQLLKVSNNPIKGIKSETIKVTFVPTDSPAKMPARNNLLNENFSMKSIVA